MATAQPHPAPSGCAGRLDRTAREGADKILWKSSPENPSVVFPAGIRLRVVNYGFLQREELEMPPTDPILESWNGSVGEDLKAHPTGSDTFRYPGFFQASSKPKSWKSLRDSLHPLQEVFPPSTALWDEIHHFLEQEHPVNPGIHRECPSLPAARVELHPSISGKEGKTLEKPGKPSVPSSSARGRKSGWVCLWKTKEKVPPWALCPALFCT